MACRGAADAQAVDFFIQQGHIRIIDVTVPSPLPAWAQSVDIGEVEVITLAQQQSADMVLIDDSDPISAYFEVEVYHFGPHWGQG